MKFSLTICRLLLLLAGPELMAQSPNLICPGADVAYGGLTKNDYQFWNAAYYWDPLISSHDIGEAEADLTISAKPTCGTAQDLKFRYVLFLDLNYDGVIETFIDSDSLPGANKIYIGNKPTDLFSGTLRKFDFRNVPAQLYWKFDLSTQTSGDTVTAHIIWKNDYGQTSTPKMPYGNHFIKWFVKDACGNESSCEYGFSVEDDQKPTVVCLNNLAVNLMNTFPAMVQLWASDFLQYTEDNFTPAAQLKIGIRRSGTGTGFPYNPNGTPQTGIQFMCEDMGTQLVELWSIDKNGNADFCETYIIIQDNMGICCDLNADIEGRITTPPGEGVANVNLSAAGNSIGLPIFTTSVFTDENGYFEINNAFPIATNASIVPTLEFDPLNGVNTFDLILISRHILGVELLNAPYKLISADANKSGTVTVFDIVELRKLILGAYNELPNNASWRFVDKSQVFADPLNPFAEVIRENLTIASIQQSMYGLDFIGCKTGDVDYTASPNFQGEPEERFFDLQTISLDDRQVKAGETFTIHLQTPAEMAGSQMTFSGKGLKINSIIPSENCTKENFGLFGTNDSAFTTPLFTAAFERGVAEFDVEFTATQDGTLSEMLNISSDITEAMAFTESGERYDLALHFIKANELAGTPVFYQNSPNPWHESTRLQFSLPEAGEVNLDVTDQNGRVVLQQKAYFAEGVHQVVFQKSQFPESGVYYVRMQSGSFSEVRKMVFFKK